MRKLFKICLFLQILMTDSLMFGLPKCTALLGSFNRRAVDHLRELRTKVDEMGRRADEFDSRAYLSLMNRSSPLKQLYSGLAVKRENLTVMQHTLEVLNLFESQRKFHLKPGAVRIGNEDAITLFRLAIALHDLGKPIAYEASNVPNHHEPSRVIAEKVLSGMKYSEPETKFILAIINGDPIGECLKGEIQPDQAAGKIRKLALQAEMTPKLFFRLLSLFYTSDAGSYDYVRLKIFDTKPSGQYQFTHPKYAEIESLLR